MQRERETKNNNNNPDLERPRVAEIPESPERRKETETHREIITGSAALALSKTRSRNGPEINFPTATR